MWWARRSNIDWRESVECLVMTAMVTLPQISLVERKRWKVVNLVLMEFLSMCQSNNDFLCTQALDNLKLKMHRDTYFLTYNLLT